MPDFRCSIASLVDDEPMVGTAPADPELLLVESPGPWGRDAISDNRLPEAVRDHLGSMNLKVLLLRRPDGSTGPGTHVFHASATATGYEVRATVLDRPEELLDLDLAALPSYDDPLWLVCTNGKRDRCCAEIGRPIAGRLAQTWPDGTWETTHLGGHRFSGTLLALPTGFTLGRLDPDTAVEACTALTRGEVPLPWTRGRAGRPAEQQAHELHVLAGGDPADEVVAVPGPGRRQSCGDDKVKGTTRFEVRATRPVEG